MKVVSWCEWREQTVIYEEHLAMIRYGHCIASSFTILPSNDGLELAQDIDLLGKAVPVPEGTKVRRWSKKVRGAKR